MKSIFSFSRSAPVQPSANAGGSDATRNLQGIAGWAHAEVTAATFLRLADDEDSARVAVQLRLLGNPLWRQDRQTHDDLLLRVRRAWPELPEEEVRRLMAHIDARARAVLSGPSRGTDQAELNKARSSWVHGWRFDRHDMEGAR